MEQLHCVRAHSHINISTILLHTQGIGNLFFLHHLQSEEEPMSRTASELHSLSALLIWCPSLCRPARSASKLCRSGNIHCDVIPSVRARSPRTSLALCFQVMVGLRGRSVS